MFFIGYMKKEHIFTWILINPLHSDNANNVNNTIVNILYWIKVKY